MQLYLGDCLIEMNKIPDHSVDMILCDLPYGTTACKWDVIIPFEPLWDHYWRVIKPNGAVVLFGNEPFSSYLRMSQIKTYKYDWVWEKERGNGFVNANKQPLKAVENIMVFYSSQVNYNPQMIPLDKPYKHVLPTSQSESHQYGCVKSDSERVYKEYTHSHPKNIIKIPREHNTKTQHPTQKPVALLEYLIKTYTNEHEIVLDNCMGSGSTLVACVNTGRNGIGIEKDEKYFEIAKQRIEQAMKPDPYELGA
jgi:DNA modification methylase